MNDATRAGIRRLLEDPLYELIPLKNVIDEAKHLPQGARVSVTASPAKGMDATLDLSEELLGMGFDVTPHLSARLTADRGHLERMLRRIEGLGIRRLFVVGGDAEEPGEFFDGISVLRAMEEIGHDLDEIGIPAYPEGHAVIPEPLLDRALEEKQPSASSMTTQMCFSGDALVGWLRARREAGITLPAILGMPGSVDRLRLLRISARIGVGDSLRFLRKNTAVASKFARLGGYNPAELLEEIGPALVDPDLDIAGVHVYTFNSCEQTEEWRRAYLAEL